MWKVFPLVCEGGFVDGQPIVTAGHPLYTGMPKITGTPVSSKIEEEATEQDPLPFPRSRIT